MKVAVLDLGSTTFHLEGFQVTGDGGVSSRLDRKRTLCLGDSVFRTGAVDDDAYRSALDATDELFVAAREFRPDELAVVATSAIRSASNGMDLVREIERRQRASVRVIGPMEEARLAYVGQSLSPLVGERRVAVVDLGGGSVEVALGRGRRCDATESLPLGAVRVRATRAAGGFDRASAAALRALIRGDLERTAAAIRNHAPELLVFGSGSARAVRSLAMRGSNSPGKVGPVDVLALRASLERHIDLPAEALVELGVDPRRASSVLVATAILAELLELCGAIPAHVSDRGLRDGVALEAHRAATRGTRAATAMVWGSLAG